MLEMYRFTGQSGVVPVDSRSVSPDGAAPPKPDGQDDRQGPDAAGVLEASEGSRADEGSARQEVPAERSKSSGGEKASAGGGSESDQTERRSRDFGFGGIWADLQNPTREELEKAAADFGVPLSFLSNSLDPEERPHALSDAGVCLIICKVSLKNGEEEGKPFQTAPLGLVITHEAVLTVCDKPGIAREFVTRALGGRGNKADSVALRPGPAGSASKDSKGAAGSGAGHAGPHGRGAKDGQSGENRTAHAEQPVRRDKGNSGECRPGVELALRLLQESGIRFIKHLQELDRLTEEIEQRMHRSMRNEDLARLMQVEKSLVYFATSLKGNLAVLDKIGSNQLFELREGEKHLLTDAMIECKQAADMAQIYLEIISSISETSASMISNNMNVIMKFLTAITLIMTVPTVIVGAYGMNVPLPFQSSPLALWIILVFTLALCWLLWRYFVKKHWM